MYIYIYLFIYIWLLYLYSAAADAYGKSNATPFVVTAPPAPASTVAPGAAEGVEESKMEETETEGPVSASMEE